MIDPKKIETARQRLRFVGRTLSNGYLDADTVDELAQAVALALRDLSDAEPQQPAAGASYLVTTHELVTVHGGDAA